VDRLETSPFDAVIVDRLSGLESLSLARVYADQSNWILVLPDDAEADRVNALDSGVDDVWSPRFSAREAVVRLKIMQRRKGGEAAGPLRGRTLEYRFDGWRLCVFTRELYSPRGDRCFLPLSDFRLLRTLLDRAPESVSPSDLDMLLGRVVNGSATRRDWRIIIHRFRKRLNRMLPGQGLVRTVRGVGYVVTAEVITVRPAERPLASPG
jgi:DNA-binding response OmpR family regulator